MPHHHVVKPQKFPGGPFKFQEISRRVFKFQISRSCRHPEIKQRIFNCTNMQIIHFILDKILKLLAYYTPFCHQSLQSYVISNGNVQFFGPPCRSAIVALSCTFSTLTLNNIVSLKSTSQVTRGY